MTKNFSKDFLIDLLNRDKFIYEEITGRTRWSILYWSVFEHDGEYWAVEYSDGATELQDERPWEYDGNEITCSKVIKEMRPTWVIAKD